MKTNKLDILIIVLAVIMLSLICLFSNVRGSELMTTIRENRHGVMGLNISNHILTKLKQAEPEYSNTCEYWDYIIDKHSQSTEENEWAKRVMRCESRCNDKAKNRYSSASGLMQIMPEYHKVDVWDGEASIEYALYKYRLGGKGLWECTYL